MWGQLPSAVCIAAIAVLAARPGAADPPPYRQAWSGHVELAILVAPVGVGHWESDYGYDMLDRRGTVEYDGFFYTGPHVGGAFGGYVAVSRNVQIGAFAFAAAGKLYSRIDDNDTWNTETREVETETLALEAGFGPAIKLGTVFRRKLFVGFAAHLGLAVFRSDVRAADTRTQLGGVVSPRAVIELPVRDGTAFDCAASFGIGLQGSMVGGRPVKSTDELETNWLRLEPIVLLGLVFGG